MSHSLRIVLTTCGVCLAASFSMPLTSSSAGAVGGVCASSPIANACDINPWPQPADLNRDLVVNGFDLVELLASWGRCGDASNCPADITGDGVVNGFDLVELLASWGPVDLAGSTFGLALVWPQGPIDFSTGNYTDATGIAHIVAHDYLPQVQVMLPRLGHYDSETGEYQSSNEGAMTGFYLETNIETIDSPASGLLPFSPVLKADNDFRIPFDWDQSREHHGWLSQVHAYYHINDFRERFFTADLIYRLDIDEERRKNVLTRQFKNELPNPAAEKKPLILGKEAISFGAQGILFQANEVHLQYIHLLNFPTQKNIVSALYDPQLVAGEYAELVAHWLIDVPDYFPSEASFGGNGWKNNVLPALTDGIATWSGYRYTGREQVFQYLIYAVRSLIPGSPLCGPDTGEIIAPSCDQAFESRNVMTFSETSDSGNGHFPYQEMTYAGGTHAAGADLGGLFFSNLYHDIVDQVGLAEEDVDALVLQVHAGIDRTDLFPMRYFGQVLLRAAAKLWPDPDDAERSIYHDQIRHTLLMRGIAVDARIPCAYMDAPDCCTDTNEPDCTPIGQAETAPVGEAGMFPPSYGAHGTFEKAIPLMIESRLPETQPVYLNGQYIYAQNWVFADGYLEPGADFDYMAYRFIKGAEYGPFDYLVVTNDMSLDMAAQGTICGEDYQPHTNDGYLTFCCVFENRELSNLTVLVDGPRLRWKRIRGRGPNEYEANYMIDTAPAGFRVIDGIKDGFAFEASGEEPVNGRRSITLSVIDPSQTEGDVYDWEVTTYELVRTPGAMDTVSRDTQVFASETSVTLHDLNVNQPIRVTLTRTRDGQSRSFTIDETVRDIDRESGLVLNFVNPAQENMANLRRQQRERAQRAASFTGTAAELE